MTMDSARNNETLRRHFHAEILNGLDSNLENVMERLGVDPEIADQVKAEKKTTDKYNRLVEKVAELHEKKAASTSKSDKAQLETEIAKLNGQIRDLSDKLKNAPAERDSFWTDKLKGKAIQNTLASYEYPEDKPKDIQMELAQILLNRKLNENKLRIEYNADSDNISLKTESGLEFYKDNTPVSFKDFAANVLAENKLLKIPAAQPPVNNSHPTPSPSRITIPGGKTADASKFFAALDDIAADSKQ